MRYQRGNDYFPDLQDHHEVRHNFKNVIVGIHCHNDSGLAIANSIAAVEAGADMVQGTINGYGERCGNADLIPIIANLKIKMGIN